MISYPWSVAGYFVLGLLGAAAFLIISLLFDKNVAILENKIIQDKRAMAAIYIFFGGILAAVMNVAANPDFGPNQYMLGFATGIGWPAIAAGIGAGKRVGEIDEKARETVKQKAEFLSATEDSRIETVRAYFEKRIEETRKSYQDRIDNLLKGTDKAAPRSKGISSSGGVSG